MQFLSIMLPETDMIVVQELTLKLEKLTEERGKKNKQLENEVTSTLTTQVLRLLITCLLG